MTKKGIAALTLEPSHPATFTSSPTTYHPNSKTPLRGTTELDKTARHSAHLRKRRHAKTERKRVESVRRAVGRTDPKMRAKLEKEDAIKSLQRNKNVTIIGKKGSNAEENKRNLGKKPNSNNNNNSMKRRN